MKKQISAVLALAALVVVGACSASPTAARTTAPDRVQADEMVPTEAPQDTTTQRVPNMMGSGN